MESAVPRVGGDCFPKELGRAMCLAGVEQPEPVAFEERRLGIRLCTGRRGETGDDKKDGGRAEPETHA